MIVFFILCVLAGFTAGAFTMALLQVAADADRRTIDEMARRDRSRRHA